MLGVAGREPPALDKLSSAMVDLAKAALKVQPPADKGAVGSEPPKIPAGDSMVEFTFVSQQSDPCIPTRKEKCPVEGTLPLVGLKFEKVKAIAYPGGDRYKLYDECEQNEFAEGC